MKKRKDIKALAKEIVALEKECQAGNQISENQNKIEQLMMRLTLEEMLELDEYIIKNKFLTK